ncbi:MAG: 2-oxoacid:acceptor oxidoreductase subunit alpha [Nanoarchaeota archaeon]|nr:2-oxoacid:acceptor oxidoreductase subunit alpha [Nanoarchaeota archaeon]
MVEVVWKIGGEAGYGILSSGDTFSHLMKDLGYYVFSITEYPSLIRGGHNTYTVRASDKPLTSHTHEIDILMALDELTIEKHKNELRKGGVIIYNGVLKPKLRRDIIPVALPLDSLSNKYGVLKKVMQATIGIGASARLLSIKKEILHELLKQRFKKKGKKVIAKNIEAFDNGYSLVKDSNFFKIKASKLNEKDCIMLDGNTAITIGAIRAGCKFMSSYPMTPATSIMQYFSSKQAEHNLIMHQAEDEISSINTALGASYAGVRSMAATSGGGFALMNEALSLAGCSETPIVIILGQRPGPATGLPTRTEQGDLLYAVHAGHGEFQRIVLAPGDASECYSMTLDAFNLADKYQLPVIILTDKYQGVSYQMIKPFNQSYKINRGELVKKTGKDLKLKEKYPRYKFTSSGVSPRTIPGIIKGVQCSIGDEHDEEGYIVEGAVERKKMMDKREKKMALVRKELSNKSVSVYGSKESGSVIISWGSTKGIILEALRELNCRFVQVKYLNPFPVKELEKKVGNYKKLFLVENNMKGQLGALIKQNTNLKITHELLKYDGRQFNPVDIISFVRRSK